jgi:ubiquinone/menaquinone biosynthesis C-methylase UbiE
MENQTGGNLYDSPDFYDAFWTENASILDDIPVYNHQFGKMLAERGSDAEFIHLDTCTGTGRIIHAVAKATLQAGLSLSNAKLIGLDISQQMLDEAARLTSPDYAPMTTWVYGSALDLVGSIPQLRGGEVKVDFVTSALGSLSELHGAGEPLQFLQEIAKVLRPGSGRVFLSFPDEMLAMAPRQEFAIGEIVEVPSKKDPSIFYRQIIHKSQATNGFLEYSATQLAITRMGEKEEILETKPIYYKFRLFLVKELEELVAQAQMKILDQIRSGTETIFEIGLK